MESSSSSSTDSETRAGNLNSEARDRWEYQEEDRAPEWGHGPSDASMRDSETGLYDPNRLAGEKPSHRIAQNLRESQPGASSLTNQAPSSRDVAVATNLEATISILYVIRQFHSHTRSPPSAPFPVPTHHQVLRRVYSLT